MPKATQHRYSSGQMTIEGLIFQGKVLKQITKPQVTLEVQAFLMQWRTRAPLRITSRLLRAKIRGLAKDRGVDKVLHR